MKDIYVRMDGWMDEISLENIDHYRIEILALYTKSSPYNK
jgi:hypothetical protein